MTAGSIAVPTIVPLRIPVGPKHVIDTQTKIELASGKADLVEKVSAGFGFYLRLQIRRVVLYSTH